MKSIYHNLIKQGCLYHRKRFFFTGFIFALYFLSTIPLTSANQEMEGNDASLNIEQLVPGSREEQTLLKQKTKPEDSLKVSLTRSAKETEGFRFSLSPLLVDYGEITPTNPLTRTVNLGIMNTATPVYSVFLTEDHPLLEEHGSFIPNTSCDAGTCTMYRASEWNNTLSFGFGYRCNNLTKSDCHQSFLAANAFRQFPDSSRSDEVTDVIRGFKADHIKKAAIVFKVNSAASQPAGNYTNTVTFITVPGY